LLGGTLTATQINARMQTAADALAAQVKRLTDAGAKYVLVVGPPNVGRSPWAVETGSATLLQNLSYNTGSGVTSMGSEGLARIQATFGNKTSNPVLFVEISGLVNTFTDGTNTTFGNRSSAICASTTAITGGGTISSTTTDSATSNGTGTGRLTAARCTLFTVDGNNPAAFVYADGVNFTPAMQSQFYSQALARMRLAAWIN
jgi:phospholipase/lecithinase/hemolysin